MGGRAGGGAGFGSRGGGYAAGVGRFKEGDIKVTNLKDKFVLVNGKSQVFLENAYGFTVNGKVLTQGGKILNYGTKFFADAMKGDVTKMKGLSGGTFDKVGHKDRAPVV